MRPCNVNWLGRLLSNLIIAPRFFEGLLTTSNIHRNTVVKSVITDGYSTVQRVDPGSLVKGLQLMTRYSRPWFCMVGGMGVEEIRLLFSNPFV